MKIRDGLNSSANVAEVTSGEQRKPRMLPTVLSEQT